MAVTQRKFSQDSNASMPFDGTERFIGLQGSPQTNKKFTIEMLHTLPSFTVSTVPSAASSTHRIIHVSNGDAGNPCIAISDGSNWKRIALGANISAS